MSQIYTNAEKSMPLRLIALIAAAALLGALWPRPTRAEGFPPEPVPRCEDEKEKDEDTKSKEKGDDAEEKKKEEKPQLIELAKGKLVLPAPAAWKRVKPRVKIIEVEIQVPPAENERIPGRITMMAATGSIKANIQRWMGQFKQPDAKSTREKAKVDELKIDGLTVHVVDISGTYLDRRGPFAPATERRDYRMLGAIIQTKKAGNYFVKFYGPEKTVAENEKAFFNMIDRLEQK